MLDSFNISTNLIVAVALAVSPHFFGSDSDIKNMNDLKTTYVAAQERAQYIIETGDMSELQGADVAMSNLALYQKNLEVIAPVMDHVGKKIAETGILDGLALPPS